VKNAFPADLFVLTLLFHFLVTQILDGGSTGSRLHIFEFVTIEQESPPEEAAVPSPAQTPSDWTTKSTNENSNGNGRNATRTDCERRGSSRAQVPLSSFGRLPTQAHVPLDPAQVAAHLLPLFDYAASVIPPKYHATTPVYYQATAGMRLLDESEQEAVYDALYQGLMQHSSFVFTSMERKDIATLSGEMEAFYGAVAANFLQGVIDTELRLIAGAADDHDDHPVVGALDMGGASAQIVYVHDTTELTVDSTATCLNTQQTAGMQPNSITRRNNNNSCQAPESPQIKDEHFFSTSYLSYGVDQFRERLWNTLVAEQSSVEQETHDRCVSKVISNPCANKGYAVEWEGFTLVGTGDTQECIRYAQRLIPHPEVPVHGPTGGKGVVGGVEHPPVRGKFLAMSLYFFSLDSLRVFSKPNEEAHKALDEAWPNPSIQELENALDGLCSRDWHTDMALQEGEHSFTRAEVLPHRCIETVYMVTLLKDGFGFPPESRDITFTFLVDDNEVEWTLGMALAMNAEEQYIAEHPDVTLEDEPWGLYGMFNPLVHGVTLPPTHCC
jgi:hypothetical protein